MNTGIVVSAEMRACLVNINGAEHKGLFHLFQYSDGNAIVELEDGKVVNVAPWDVKFTDNKMLEYAFE